MKIQIKTILGAFLLSSITNCYASTLLTEEQINEAQSLASQTIRFEDYKDQQKSKEKDAQKGWLTLAEFEFNYKGAKKKLCMAHGVCGGNWGEVAVYP